MLYSLVSDANTHAHKQNENDYTQVAGFVERNVIREIFVHQHFVISFILFIVGQVN